MAVQWLDTDVLVIGGGAAGCQAALRAQQLGARVLMVVKGKIGRSGGTPLAAFLVEPPPLPVPAPLFPWLKALYSLVSHLWAVPFPGRYESAFQTALRTHYWLVDQDYFLDALAWMAGYFFPRLESRGLYIRRDEEGNPVTPPQRYYRYFMLHKCGMGGYQFGESRRKEVLSAGIPVMEEAMAFDLLRGPGGEVAGAVVLDYARGRVYAVRAKATILATGHTNWLARRATGTREMAANGLAMAARAGAPLTNLEIQWYHASDSAGVFPECWARMQHYPNPLPGSPHQAVMLNSAGEEYLRCEDFKEGIPYTIQVKALYQQIRQGKARWDGGNYTSFKFVDPQALRDYQYHWDFYQEIGLDMGKDPLESGVTWHMTGGGVHLNPRSMEGGVPGLFAAGAVGGHQLGSVTFASYDGWVAGTSATRRARRVAQPPVDEAQVSRHLDALDRLSSRQEGPLPIQVKWRIRDIVWEWLLFHRSEQRINRALEELGRVREELLPAMRLGTRTSRFNTDLMDALDARDMVEVAEMVAHAALARRESRGPHYREDFPFTDNREWLKRVVVSREGQEVKVRLEPVRMRYRRPPAQVVDYFADPYA